MGQTEEPPHAQRHTHAAMLEVSSLCTHPGRPTSLSLFHSNSLSVSLHRVTGRTDQGICSLTCQTWL